jgi:hypothetical protein
MIKATAKGPDGRPLLIIGLEFGNLDRFREQPGDTYIRIDGREMGIPMDVMIFSGRTAADCAASLKAGIGPDTKIHRSPKSEV